MGKIRHGLCKHPLYSTWASMKHRCHNPDDHSFHRYGGRGISMCDQWCDSPAQFIQDILSVIGPRPKGKSLHRIDNDGHYELIHRVTGLPQLKWADAQEQSDPKNQHRPVVEGHVVPDAGYTAYRNRLRQERAELTAPSLDELLNAHANRVLYAV
jgi:hypothetical protein